NGNEFIDKRAVGTVVTEDIASEACHDIEMAIRPESHARRTIEAATVRRNESINKKAVCGVIAKHTTAQLAAHVKKRPSKLQPHGVIQSATAGRDKRINERA